MNLKFHSIFQKKSKKMPMHPECTGIYHSKHHFQDQNLLYSHVEM